ncbi:MAG TPA: serine/threonine-protein kinase [Polyangiaceae bacterium]|jgi:serine/threonine-protein kinase
MGESAPEVDEDVIAARARIGQTLGGKWRLDELLGVGGMAAVYAATHKNNLKSVAVKVLHVELQRNEAVRTRFLREGYVANKVGHPGAVAAIDDGVDEEGAVYLVMERLSGQSLAQRVDSQGGKLGVREVLVVAEGILDVLAAAHAQNVVHRDLKPDNVFLTGDGGVKVLDFGVARVLENTGDAKTRTGVVMGTPEYMPPEQARGRSEHIDGRTDLWALGAMMFRLVTGRYVHVAETQNEVLLLAMTEPAKKIADVMPSIQPKVAEVIDRALAYEPLDRWKDAESMRAAVKSALAAVEEQDSKATLAAPLVHDDDDEVDDAATTIPVSDFVRAKTTPSSPRAIDDSPKPSLWVHTKATPPEPPKPPQKKRPLLPIAIASAALAALCVGIAYELPKNHDAAPPPAPSTLAAPSASVAEEVDAAADDDAGDELDMDEDDAAAAPAPSSTAKHTPAAHPTSRPRPHHKKRRH